MGSASSCASSTAAATRISSPRRASALLGIPSPAFQSFAKCFLRLDLLPRRATGLELVAGDRAEVTIEPLPVEVTAVDTRPFAHSVRGACEPACPSRLVLDRGENRSLFEPERNQLLVSHALGGIE